MHYSSRKSHEHLKCHIPLQLGWAKTKYPRYIFCTRKHAFPPLTAPCPSLSHRACLRKQGLVSRRIFLDGGPWALVVPQSTESFWFSVALETSLNLAVSAWWWGEKKLSPSFMSCKLWWLISWLYGWMAFFSLPCRTINHKQYVCYL